MRSAGFGPAYKSLTVQPAPRVKNRPGFHKFGWSTNFEEMKKMFFLKKERLYLNNKYFQQKTFPTLTSKKKQKNINTRNEYNLFR